MSGVVSQQRDIDAGLRGIAARQWWNVLVVIAAFRRVFRKFPYLLLAIVTATLFLLFAIWLPNLHLLRLTMTSDAFDAVDKLNVFLSSLGAIETNFSTLTRNLTIAVSLLSGINIALLAYYLKRRIALEKAAGVGFFGTAIGLIGVGCASCGSVILSSIFGIGASTGFLGLFPLRGAEFGIAGVALLLVSIVLVAKKIENPLVCKPD